MPADPKKPPVRLSKKEYHLQRVRLYNEQEFNCKVCGGHMEFDHAAFHHTETGGMGMKGDDDKGFLTHKLCHPPKKKVWFERLVSKEDCDKFIAESRKNETDGDR
jgi:hypothetical protein